MERYIYLLFLFGWELILLCYAWKKFNKVFFSPSLYTLSVFAVSTLLCIYCINYWQIHFHPIAFWVIGLGLLTMVIAESCSFRRKRIKEGKSDTYIFRLPSIVKIGLSLYCVLATFLYYREIQNIGLAHAMGMNEAIANVKEDWELYESQFNPIVRQGYKMVMGIAYCFTFIFVNNYNVCKRKFSENFWYILPLFCGVGINLISGSRGDMVRMLLLFLFTYYICKWQATNWKVQPSRQIIKVALPAFAAVLSIFFMARLFVKVDVENQKNIGGPVEYLAYYIGSPIQVFNIHAKQLEQHRDKNSNATFGVSCFGGMYSLLKNLNVLDKSDIKSNRVGVGFAEIGGDSNAAGNVDTIFACPYVDFGLIGMCIYIFIIYAVISYFFYRNILYERMSMKYIKNFIIFSFFFYEIEMSFYSDVIYLIFSQTGILQFICLWILMHYIIRPKYLVPVDVKKLDVK